MHAFYFRYARYKSINLEIVKITSEVYYSFFITPFVLPSLFILSLIFSNSSSTLAPKNNNNNVLAPKIRKKRQSSNNEILSILPESPIFELDLNIETELKFEVEKDALLSFLGQKPIGFKVNNKRKSLIYKPPTATKQFTPFSEKLPIWQLTFNR